MKFLFRLLLIGLAAPTLLGGCAAYQVKTPTAHQKRVQSSLSAAELVEINRQWNLLVTYKEDSLEDHWQSPTETVTLKTGDCEDISIAKMLDPAIRKSIPAEQLRLSYVHTPAGLPHMVLIIGQGDKALVLDNLFDEVKTLAASGYQPVYQLDANGLVYRNDRLLDSHPRFEKFELILAELDLDAAY